MGQISESDRHSTHGMQQRHGALARSHATTEQDRLVPDTVRQIRSLVTSGLQAREKLCAGLEDILQDANAGEDEHIRGLLNDIARVVTEFEVEESAFTVGRRLLPRLFGENASTRFCQQCGAVREQTDMMVKALEHSQRKLLKDIARLERRYQENLECHLRLESYLKAGQAKLQTLHEALTPSEGSVASAAAGRLRLTQRNDLEEELKNLQRTLDSTMPRLSSLRLYQDSQKALVNKIHTTISHALLRWRNQLTRTVAALSEGTPPATTPTVKARAKEAVIATRSHPINPFSSMEGTPATDAIVDAAAMREVQLTVAMSIREAESVAETAGLRRAQIGEHPQALA